MKSTRQKLEAARDLIADERRWVQGALAASRIDYDRDGYRYTFGARYCALGAINHATGHSQKKNVVWRNRKVVKALANVLPGNGKPARKVFQYNDSHDHECVIAAFDRAIEKCS